MILRARNYLPVDNVALDRIHDDVYPHDRLSGENIGDHIAFALEHGGRAWVIEIDNETLGYSYITPVPGLNGLYDIQGCIETGQQGKGFGGKFLKYIIADLAGSQVKQISHRVSSLESPESLFLRRYGFFVEHEEWLMRLESLGGLPTTKTDSHFTIQSFSKKSAIQLYRQLYKESFHGLPWYQPYESDREVAGELLDSEDLLFLFDDNKPAGFAWLRWPEPHIGEIEPIGIVKSYQGKGLGRYLLLSSLHCLKENGAQKVHIGVWGDNRHAIRLYKDLGFHRLETLIFLAYDI